MATQLVTGAVSIVSALIAYHSRTRAIQLKKELDNEAALIQGVVGRTQALEFQLTAAAIREGELKSEMRALERALHDKSHEVAVLTMRLEAMKENYGELLDKYNSAVKALVGDFNQAFERPTQRPPPPK